MMAVEDIEIHSEPLRLVYSTRRPKRHLEKQEFLLKKICLEQHYSFLDTFLLFNIKIDFYTVATNIFTCCIIPKDPANNMTFGCQYQSSCGYWTSFIGGKAYRIILPFGNCLLAPSRTFLILQDHVYVYMETNSSLY